MSIKKRPLLVIEWEDMTSFDNWEDEGGIKGERPLICVTVGWELPADKGYIALTSMRSDAGRCNDRIVIPRKAIKSIRKIE